MKKAIKKTLALALASLMAATTFAACGKTPASTPTDATNR